MEAFELLYELLYAAKFRKLREDEGWVEAEWKVLRENRRTVNDPRPLQRKIEKAIKKGKTTCREIACATNTKEDVTRRALKRMEKAGRVRITKEPGQVRNTYSLEEA